MSSPSSPNWLARSPAAPSSWSATRTRPCPCSRTAPWPGYRAWEQAGRTPAYPFGHGLGYTDWTYDSLDLDGTTARIRLRNTGERPGREVVQVYLSRPSPTPGARPGESVEVTVALPRRAFGTWDETANAWAFVKGSYEISAGRSIPDRRRTAPINV